MAKTAAASYRQPKEMYWLALCEMCQRFAFWGVGNILVLYLVQAMNLGETQADHIFGMFTGIAFILPIAGGYLADRLCYRTSLIAGGISTALGALVLTGGGSVTLFIGLFLMALGASLFTPSVYTLLGELYHERPHLREAGFTIYYASVNIGVFAATFTMGALGSAGHWNLAFILAALVALAGLYCYRLSQPKEEALKSISKKRAAKQQRALLPLSAHERGRIFVIAILALFSILFWIAYNQGGSSMNLFALHHTDRQMGNFQIPAAWLLSSESLYLVLLAFPLSALYHKLRQRKQDPSPPAKEALSLLFIGFCFTIMTFATLRMGSSSLTSPGYLLLAYFFMAVGEMLICPIGLSLITHIAPRRMTALMVGLWYLSIGIANYTGGYVAGWMDNGLSLPTFFALFAAITLAGSWALSMLVPRLNRLRHLESL